MRTSHLFTHLWSAPVMLAFINGWLSGCALPVERTYDNQPLRHQYEAEFSQRELAPIEGFWRCDNQYGEGTGVWFRTDPSQNGGFQFACRSISARLRAPAIYRMDFDQIGARFNSTPDPNKYLGQAILVRGSQQYWGDVTLTLLSPILAEWNVQTSEPLLGGNNQRSHLVGPKKALESRLRAASQPSSGPADLGHDISFGSGFLVSNTAIVTNRHVVENAREILCRLPDKTYPARLLAQDPDNDLAILGIDGATMAGRPFSLAESRFVSKGQQVFAMGFPLPQLLGEEMRVHAGHVSSLTGFQGRGTQFQIEMSIHPGNSGGPVLRQDGDVIGIVMSKLSARYMVASGDVPQGISFAVKADLLRPLLASAGIAQEVKFAEQPGTELPLDRLAEQFRGSVVRVEARR